jgi:hypothetical protein
MQHAARSDAKTETLASHAREQGHAAPVESRPPVPSPIGRILGVSTLPTLAFAASIYRAERS